MIIITEALSWLNQFDQSHLGGTNQQLLAIARDYRTAKEIIPSILKAAVDQAKASPRDGLDYSETLLQCLAIEYERGLKDEARSRIAEIKQLYQSSKDPHGAVVALWVCGIAEFNLPDTDTCFRDWQDAIESIDKLLPSYKRSPDTQKWYSDILMKMYQDLVTLPQEAFGWLNRFVNRAPASYLSLSNRQLVDILNENINNRQFDLAYQRIAELKDSSKASLDSLEPAEIFAETGLAAYRMDNPLEAMNDFRTALVRYPARSHHQEVIRWILGAVQWSRNSERINAKTNWEKSLDGFQELCRKADQKNDQSLKAWYNEKMRYMQGALQGKITEYL